MCGIAGFFQPIQHQNESEAQNILALMGSAIKRRGPDGAGEWFDPKEGIGLSHRRLSIVDLSSAGAQPMHSKDGRYVLSFNGEIYNFQSLRKECDERAQIKWIGHSDTEVLLSCFELFGFEQTLQKIVGMFAIALWDKKEKALYLARDRFGEKPLYYSTQNQSLFFGSELSALKAHPNYKATINRDVLPLYLQLAYIPAPYSIYEDTYKLEAANYLKVTFKNEKIKLQTKCYWDLNQIVESQSLNTSSLNESEVINHLEQLLKQSVKDQMVSDVPLGAFLSGGIDSSTVVALMQAQSSKSVKTYSIGFNEENYNEAQHAKLVADHLKTEHTELYVKSEDALKVIPMLSDIYSEPFADSSQIPTFLVSKMAKDHVTVALSGDGGDELFGGYNRYVLGQNLWNKVSNIPAFLLNPAAASIGLLKANSLNRLGQKLGVNTPHLGDKIEKLKSALRAKNQEELYLRIVSLWPPGHQAVKSTSTLKHTLVDPTKWPKNLDFTHWMMAMDAKTYLSDDILTKVDRAAMYNSLETRVPMLDHRIFEFAWSLPLNLKIKNGEGKWPLKQVLYKHVPKEIIDRPKMGFSIPLDEWLRGPLKEWAYELIKPERLEKEGFFHSNIILKYWNEHQSRHHNWQHQLWCVLMFQDWLEKERS